MCIEFVCAPINALYMTAHTDVFFALTIIAYFIPSAVVEVLIVYYILAD